MSPLRPKLFLYGAGAAVLAALWYFALYTPVHRELLIVRGEIAETERQLKDYSRIIEQLPAFLKANQDLESRRKELNSSLYAKGDILKLFQELARNADIYRLKLVQISPPVSELLKLNEQVLADSDPLFLHVTLDFEGHYEDFGRFVSRLETRPYFRDIRSCLIRGRKEPGSLIDLSLSFKALLGIVEVTS